MIARRAFALVFCLFCGHTASHADPWLPPGDDGLRSDIQRLADAYILNGPVTTWPLSWPDIARDVLAASPAGLDDATLSALLRVQRLARIAPQRGFSGTGLRVGAAYEPQELRAFADSPRERGEVALRASWLSDHFALNVQAAYVTDPADGKRLRPDGSYLGVNVGNFVISAGFMERWWGPGWDGSLILGTNARPIPSLTLERNYTDPFKTRLLSWLGTWRASIAVGQAEDSGAVLPKIQFLAARVNFKPRQWLEIGLTRTAQWCGGTRRCDWETFTDMLIGRDNQESTEDQPGNQLAGYDLRLRSPWQALPVAFYTQWIGEDEAGGLPSKFMGQFGIESWGSSLLGGWRLRAEYSDTTCDFLRETPQFDCGYRNSIYPDGYTHRGRVIGHPIDNDSRMFSVAGILSRENGDVMSVALRRVDVNRDGGGQEISDVPIELDNVELRYSRALGAGKLSFGIGYDDPAIEAGSSPRLHGFASWQQGF